MELQDIKKPGTNTNVFHLDYIRSWLSQFGNHVLVNEESWTNLQLKNLKSPTDALKKNLPQNIVTETDHMKQAAKLRLHTPIQKQVYVALVTAKNTKDSVQKLLKLANSKKKIPTVIAVIVYLALKEIQFNPYYPHILNDLATMRSNLGTLYKNYIKETLISQLAMLNCLQDYQIKVFAKFLAHIFLKTSIAELRVIRFIKKEEVDENKMDLFLKTLCTELITTKLEDKDAEDLWEMQIETLKTSKDYKYKFQNILESLDTKVEQAERMKKILSY